MIICKWRQNQLDTALMAPMAHFYYSQEKAMVISVVFIPLELLN